LDVTKYFEKGEYRMCISLFEKLFMWFWGGWDRMMQSLVAFVVVEAFSSILVCLFERPTKKSFERWIAKRVTLFLIVGIGNIADCYLASGGNTFRTINILFYIGYEGAAILKNAKILDLPQPPGLTKFLMKLIHDKDDDMQ